MHTHSNRSSCYLLRHSIALILLLPLVITYSGTVNALTIVNRTPQNFTKVIVSLLGTTIPNVVDSVFFVNFPLNSGARTDISVHDFQGLVNRAGHIPGNTPMHLKIEVKVGDHGFEIFNSPLSFNALMTLVSSRRRISILPTLHASTNPFGAEEDSD